ncbi:MAG: hexulose-6-phosphate isomerase [Halobacteriovoraceae bacterium]|nr:hexulose-6-phosphate isomerase [Halobacteriovoraceae bacterium]
MNSKNKKTLEKVFKDPVSPSIPWRDIEKLFQALGAEISEGSGSRVRVKLGDTFAVFHRPHPEKVTDKGAVKSVRRFLENSNQLKTLEDDDA